MPDTRINDDAYRGPVREQPTLTVTKEMTSPGPMQCQCGRQIPAGTPYNLAIAWWRSHPLPTQARRCVICPLDD